MDGCDKTGPRVGLLGTNYTNRWVATHVTRVHMYSPEVLNVLAWFPEKSGLCLWESLRRGCAVWQAENKHR